MQDMFTVGDSVWDPVSPISAETPASGAEYDDLPPFAALTTDDERERKAEVTSPGTYNVIVNPKSFQHLPEYNDVSEVRRVGPAPQRRASLAPSVTGNRERDLRIDDGHKAQGECHGSDDPNVVVLRRFEDATRRATSQWKESRSSNSPPNTASSLAVNTFMAEDHDDFDATQSLINRASGASSDSHLLRHFHSHVWPQLAEVERETVAETSNPAVESHAEVLEPVARVFPPLFHAMMAVAALSLAHQQGIERLDALQHYQQALPALQSNLRTSDDLSSDGAFLTHFLLLVYEIAAAERAGSNLWSSHLGQLLRICLLRREVFGGEKYPFITWWICNIDLYALFSGAGRGEFVETMLKNEMIPPPSFHLYPLGIDGSSIYYPEEVGSLPAILQTGYEVTVLAVRLGLLAQEIREEARPPPLDTQQLRSHRRQAAAATPWQRKVFELQEDLRHLWASPSNLMLECRPDMLPFRSRRLFDLACALHRACQIYSLTSMWPCQQLDTRSECEGEIAQYVSDILRIGDRIVQEEQYHLRFIIFPLFMAGFASADGGDKMHALELISRMEKDSIGRNTTSTRHALQKVYEEQTQRFIRTGQTLDVDWKDVMLEQGLQVVNFGW